MIKGVFQYLTTVKLNTSKIVEPTKKSKHHTLCSSILSLTNTLNVASDTLPHNANLTHAGGCPTRRRELGLMIFVRCFIMKGYCCHYVAPFGVCFYTLCVCHEIGKLNSSKMQWSCYNLFQTPIYKLLVYKLWYGLLLTYCPLSMHISVIFCGYVWLAVSVHIVLSL